MLQAADAAAGEAGEDGGELRAEDGRHDAARAAQARPAKRSTRHCY